MKIGQILAALITTAVIGVGGFAAYQNLPELNGKSMTSSQINVMERQIAEAFATAFSHASSGYSCNSNGSSCLVRMTIDDATNCTAGGNIHTLGSWSGTATSSLANFSLSATQTISDWRCISGWVVNGDPYISYTGQVTGTGASVTSSVRQGLGWKAVKTTDATKKQSCQTAGDIAYSSNGLGHANFRMSCVPGGSKNFNMSL